MNRMILSVVSFCAVFFSASATTYYWGSDAGDGNFEDTTKWRYSKPTGSAANAYPSATTDIAAFGNGDTRNGVTATVTVNGTSDVVLPLIHFYAGSDIVLSLPAGVTSSPVAYTASTGSGFGSPWGFGSGMGRLTIVGGTLDMLGSPILRNNQGTPQIVFRGEALRNSTWQPSELDASYPVVFGVGPGTRLENFTFVSQNVATNYPAPQIWIAGEGTFASNFTLKAAISSSPQEVWITNGATVVDSAFNLSAYGKLTFGGAAVSNTTVKLNCSDGTLSISNNTRFVGGKLQFAGDAGNEHRWRNSFAARDAVFDGTEFVTTYWTHELKATIGPNAIFTNVTTFAFGGDCDYSLVGPGTAVCADDLAIDVWTVGGGVTNRVISVENGAELRCASLKWEAASRPEIGNVLRVVGEGSRILVCPYASSFAASASAVKIAYGNNSSTLSTSNRIEIVDGGVFAVVEREGEDYSGLNSYTESVSFFGAGYGNTNEMVVASGGVFTNDFSFIYGNNYYRNGGNNNKVIVSNGTFHCGMKLRMGAQNSTYLNTFGVVCGGVARVGSLYLSEHGSASGNRVVCRDASIVVTNFIYSANTSEDNGRTELRIGGSTGGVTAPYLNNIAADQAPMQVAFEIPDCGKTDSTPYLTLTSEDNSGIGGGFRTGNTGTATGFALSFDLSDKWVNKTRDKYSVDLVAVKTNSRNTLQLGRIVETVDADELKGCTLAIVDKSDGTSVLRLSPIGKSGMMLFVR